MILLISSALMPSIFLDHLSTLSGCKFLLYRSQLRAYRAVVDHRAYSRDRAANKRGVGLELKVHPLARQLLQPARECIVLAGVDGNGRRHFGGNHPGSFVHLAVKLLIDLTKLMQSIVTQQ